MKPATLGLLLAAAACSSLQAAGTLELQSPTPTRVYLDGDYVGETPLVLSQITAGEHQVQVEDPASGEIRTFLFHSPKSAHVHKVLDVSGGLAPVAVPVPAEPVHDVRPVVYQPVPVPVSRPSKQVCRVPPRRHRSHTWGRRATPVVYPQTPYVPSQPVSVQPRSRVEKAKVHTRNTLFGLGLANQLLNKNDRDRNRFRNVGLGLAALNEILR